MKKHYKVFDGIEYDGNRISCIGRIHRDKIDRRDSVQISWYIETEDGELYFERNYEFDTFNEAYRFLVDFSNTSAQDLVDCFTSI